MLAGREQRALRRPGGVAAASLAQSGVWGCIPAGGRVAFSRRCAGPSFDTPINMHIKRRSRCAVLAAFPGWRMQAGHAGVVRPAPEPTTEKPVPAMAGTGWHANAGARAAFYCDAGASGGVAASDGAFSGSASGAASPSPCGALAAS